MRSIFELVFLGGIGAFLMIASVGCDDSPTQKAQQTQNSVEHPQVIAQMNDGRTLYCVEVHNPDSFYTHFIYYFGKTDTNTVSINYTVPQGKTSRNEVLVLDGKIYNLVEVTN